MYQTPRPHFAIFGTQGSSSDNDTIDQRSLMFLPSRSKVTTDLYQQILSVYVSVCLCRRFFIWVRVVPYHMMCSDLSYLAIAKLQL